MYYIKLEKNNIVYSVDMLRLKTYISYSLFSEIEFRFKTCWKEFVKMSYTTPQQKEFFYNYVIKIDDDNSFWFGFCHNNEKRSSCDGAKYNFTINFNPNKIKDNHILMYLLGLSSEWFIKSVDLAMDLKINILDIIIDKKLKRTLSYICNGFDDKTFRVGKGDGHYKIYNKKKEAKLNISGDLTRVEVSKEFDDFPVKSMKLFKFPSSDLPTLYLQNYLYSFKDYEDKTLLALLYAVQSGFPLSDLTRTYKSKIRKLLEGGSRILFDDVIATQVVNATIFKYFLRRGSKVVFL